jgi:hypothetical protein
MDPDEAMQKLKEREAAASTQPSDPNTEITTLKSVITDQAKQIDALKVQVTQLIAQNSALKKQIAANPPPVTDAGPDGAKIWKGMTKAQILDALGPSTLDRTDSDGTETIEWNRILPKRAPQIMDPTQAWIAMQGAGSGPYSQVTKKTMWTLNHDITAELHDGKVTDFSDQQQN